MTRTTNTDTGCLHCGSTVQALPEGIDDEDGQTWFADGDIRVDNTGPWGPAVYIHGVETTANALRGGDGEAGRRSGRGPRRQKPPVNHPADNPPR